MTETDAAPSTEDLEVWRSAEEFVTLAEIARAARERLEPGPWNFLDGGAGDERGLLENRAAFARWRFRPRFMAGISRPDPSTSLLGVDLSMPVITSPFGFDMLFHPDGHTAVAEANEAEGVAMVAPEISSRGLEDLAAAAPTACRFFQLVPAGTEDHFLRMVERCADAGYSAVCVTVDTPMPGWRERSMEDRFVPDVASALGNHRPDLGVDLVASLASMVRFDEPTWTWEQLGEVGRRAALPWFPKGVLTREDARAAVEAGASAIFVSNHGARQLEFAPATLDALVEVVAEVGDEVPVLMDGGVRRGSDIALAVALGATAVGVGRPVALGLAAGGRAGVERTFQLLHDELVTTMALIGCGELGDLDPTRVQRAPGS
jgi:4-hydroxymandelate oxidase